MGPIQPWVGTIMHKVKCKSTAYHRNLDLGQEEGEEERSTAAALGTGGHHISPRTLKHSGGFNLGSVNKNPSKDMQVM